MSFRTDIGNLTLYSKNHDLTLPEWGPWSQEYAGISHLWGDSAGRFTEFSFVCGFFGGARIAPKTSNDEGYHHWQANHDLSFYSYRYQLEWKDQVFADLEFFQTEVNARLAKITFHNRHDFPQQFEIILVTTVREPHQWTTLHLLPGESWIPAENWKTLSHWDQFQQDGLKRGVQSGDIFVDGQALGDTTFGAIFDQTFPPLGHKNRQVKGSGFGLNLNDSVGYEFEVRRDFHRACLQFRYALTGEQAVNFKLEIAGRDYEFVLSPTTETKIAFSAIQFSPVEIGKLSAGKKQLTLRVTGFTPAQSRQKGEFILDGILLTEDNADLYHPPRVRLVQHQTRFTYALNAGQTGFTFSPKTAQESGTDTPHYAVWSEFEREPTFKFYEDLQYLYLQPLRELAAPDFYQQVKRLQIRPGFLQQPGSSNQFLMYRLKPIFCEPNGSKEIYLTIAAHTQPETALENAKTLFQQRQTIETSVRNQFETERYRATHPDYAFSQERMLTQLLTNVGFSARLQGKPVRHYTPGKAWGGLYFWDAGFHGLGLLEYSPKRALECMNTYLTDLENTDHAFIMHGTPLPVMIYLYWQIFQKTGRRDVLEFFYPKLKRMYNFLAGKSEHSTTDKFKNGLLTSFDYFYNSGGWDDYPPQAWVHAAGLADDFATAVFPSHIIRSAKILQLAAHLLEDDHDILAFGQDIQYFAQALQEWSWDEQAGYFSYVQNSNKKPLLFNQSVNFNMGLDGASPLIAGIVTDAQRKILLEKLKSPRHLWTDIGLSAVDQSAPYFSRGEGYWNGRVWMPHQWFFWKALIGEGELTFAHKIARTAIDLWAREVERTGHLWENFIIKTGRGAGCHQFGALSAPVIEFHNAYLRPGQITTGFDAVLHETHFSHQKNQLEFVLSSPFAPGKTGVVAVFARPGEYRVRSASEEFRVQSDATGALQFLVRTNTTPERVVISAC